MPSPASQAVVLGLPAPTAQNYKDFTATVIDELLPGYTHSLEAALGELGYIGDPSDSESVTSFLLSSLQAHRILQHKKAKPPPDNDDARLADVISQACRALNLPPSDASLDIPGLVRLLDTINSSLKERMPNSEARTEALGTFLSPQLTPEQLAKCEQIHSQLQAEHETRIGLLTTRLNVTIQSFSRSPRAHNHVFDPIAARVEQMRRKAEGVSLYEALVARQFVMREKKVSEAELDKDLAEGEDVKNYLMGAVPDRGGRLTGASMPEFRGRIPSNTEARGGRHKGKGGKRRKGR